jgi:AcrR family transcriptional regulator
VTPTAAGSATGKRGGRRGGDADTRGDILRAAREQFAAGYAATSIRAIARQAGVDPSLIVQFFGGKDGLFEAVLSDAIRPREGIEPVLAGDPATVGHRLAEYFFGIWEDPERRYAFQAMLQSAGENDTAAELIRRFVTGEIVGRLASASRRKDAALRAELAGSQLIGAALVRYVYRIPPLCDVPIEQVVRPVGAVIQQYLHPPGALQTR